MPSGMPLRFRGSTVGVDIQANNASQIPFRVKDASGTTLFSIDGDGDVVFATGATISGGILGTILSVNVSLTAAQILDLADTPVELVAAPGAGKFLRFHGANLLLDHAGTGFAEVADNLQVSYENEAGAKASQVIEMTGFIDQTADTITTAEPKIDAIVAATGAANKALVIANINDDFTDAGTTTSVLRIQTFYSVHSTGF